MKIAVVGATGAVGETILAVLEERDVPVAQLAPFASRERPAAVRFRGDRLDVRAASDDALRGYDVVFFAGGEDASERYAPALIEGGAVVIDNSATFRMQQGVPLIVPEVNADEMRREHRLFPVANCTAILLCTALFPIRDVAGLKTVHVATYQAASGAGRPGLDEFEAGERAVVSGAAEPAPAVFPRQLARNVVPQVGSFDDEGWSGEECKVREESKKMLGLPDLEVSVTSVRVPVRTAHSAAVFVQTRRATSRADLATAFERAPGIVFHSSGIVTPRDVEGTDEVHVARLRALRQAQGDTREGQAGAGTDFALWCVADQLRKGAATNAVQILELLLQKGFLAA
ncbi:MAG TPA: aspartate-semialdehyde dehydrogenase [Candidatus Cybelea sp.]|jgi:aspartate-semialdehyde dehydrogenase|nr:aspartate-semialdehyde dehydrogenase [Candidatus Cybelea sp.]